MKLLSVFYELKQKFVVFSVIITSLVHNANKMINLDVTLKDDIKKANELKNKLGEVVKKGSNFKPSKDNKRNKQEMLKLKKELERLQKEIKNKINKVVKEVHLELKYLKNLTLEDKLLFRSNKRLEILAKYLLSNNQINMEHKRELLNELKKKALILKKYAYHFVAEAEDLRKNKPNIGINALLLAQVSFKNEHNVMRRINRTAIQIQALEKMIDELDPRDFSKMLLYFHQELVHIYYLGNYKTILIRRLKKNFNELRNEFEPLKIKGLNNSFKQSEKQFVNFFKHIEKLSRNLSYVIAYKFEEFNKLNVDEQIQKENDAHKMHNEHRKIFEQKRKQDRIDSRRIKPAA